MLTFTTVSGLAEAGKIVDVNVPEVGGEQECYIFPRSPSLLSVGQFCMSQGYAFSWKPGESPYVIRLDGFVVRFEVVVNVPILRLGSELSSLVPLRRKDLVIEWESETATLAVEGGARNCQVRKSRITMPANLSSTGKKNPPMTIQVQERRADPLIDGELRRMSTRLSISGPTSHLTRTAPPACERR